MEDMNNLKSFLNSRINSDERIDEFSIDNLKELRYLASLALVEALCNEHGECMKRIFKENKHDKA